MSKNEELKKQLEAAKREKEKMKQERREARAKAREARHAKRAVEKDKETKPAEKEPIKQDEPKPAPKKAETKPKAETKQDMKNAKSAPKQKPKAEPKPKQPASPEDNVFKSVSDKGFLVLKNSLNVIDALFGLAIAVSAGYLFYLLHGHADIYFNSLLVKTLIGAVSVVGLFQLAYTGVAIGKPEKEVNHSQVSLIDAFALILFALLNHFTQYHDLNIVNAYNTESYHLLVIVLLLLIVSAVFSLVASFVDNYVIKKHIQTEPTPEPVNLKAHKVVVDEERKAPRKEETEK